MLKVVVHVECLVTSAVSCRGVDGMAKEVETTGTKKTNEMVSCESYDVPDQDLMASEQHLGAHRPPS